jgi:hypothetical protein
MYAFNEITLVVVMSYGLCALDISTLPKMIFGDSAISETKQKHQTAPPSADKIDGFNTMEHINNVLNDELHHNNTDNCKSSDSSDGRSSTHINRTNKSESRLFLESYLESTSSCKSTLFVTDHIEDKWVYVNESRVTSMYSQVEEGLFAKSNIPTNEVIAFFGGFRYSKQTWEDMKLLDPVYFRPLYMEPGMYLL